MNPLLLIPPALVVALALDQGGFGASAWVWSGALAAWAAATATVTSRELHLSRAAWAWLAGACAVLAWVSLSWLWSDRRAQTVLELRRTAVYAAAAMALVVLVRRATAQRLLALTHTAIVVVVVYALARYLTGTRPVDPFEGTLLSQPLGYANALAALAAIGVVLGVGLAATARAPWERAALAGSVPSLAAALPLTHSRGAAVALIAGLAVVVLPTEDAGPLVREALVVAPGCAIVAIASATSRLGDANATPRAHAAWVIGVLAVVCTAGTAAAALHIASPTRARRVPRLAVAATLALGALAAIVGAGLTQPRPSLWGVAWHEFESHVVAGGGAGTFALAWARSGLIETRGGALDAHSLYLETLAELGVVGLVLLLVFLALPLARVRRGNGAVAAGAYTVFLVHAGLDWDWEMPAVVMAGLCCGAAALACAEEQPRPVVAVRRAALVALALAVGALSIAGARSSSEPGVARPLVLAVLGARVPAVSVVVPVALPVMLLPSGLGRAGRERVAVAEVRLERPRRHGDQVPRMLLRMRAVADLHAVLLARRAVLVLRGRRAVLTA